MERDDNLKNDIQKLYNMKALKLTDSQLYMV